MNSLQRVRVERAEQWPHYYADGWDTASLRVRQTEHGRHGVVTFASLRDRCYRDVPARNNNAMSATLVHWYGKKLFFSGGETFNGLVQGYPTFVFRFRVPLGVFTINTRRQARIKRRTE